MEEVVWGVCWLARERAREASGGREERWREAVRGRGRVGGGESGGESSGGLSVDISKGEVVGGRREGVGENCLGGEGEGSRFVPGCSGGKKPHLAL